jgi:hypothetical protein
MRQRWIVRTGLFLGLSLAAGFFISGQQRAEARPLYFMKAFRPAYPKLDAEIKKAQCTVCHYGMNKKDRNNYGTALHEALGKNEKEIKDLEKVTQALKKIEEKPSAVSGKTFGQLIQEGKLPATGFAPKVAGAN